ncbi:MAG: AAA family ATPase, partial [Gemmatimonadota bacterium]|nr:AAA family ATPase [Gemmatimonadota bacterium]
MNFGDMLRSSADSLARFTRDLTAEARAGRLEPVRCRDNEIARVIDILLRHGKNNPALVGAAGTGKTAIAEGFAQRIAAGKVPFALREARVLALDHAGLLAGTMYRGQYEERLTAIVEACSADPHIILFIDELHNLIGQGAAMGVAMDAANMLKPALVRGEFRVIGATTDDEYQRWVLGDPALERRFQKISITELSAVDTLAVLEARRERLERHHNVSIADEALTASVALTDRYVTDRVRPDRAIDALDEACAHAQATATYSHTTETLIRERLALLREAERVGAPSRERVAEEQLTPDESLEKMARNGLAALERFGLELEAAFTGAPAPAPAPAAAAPAPAAPSAT